jgi:hypothetical protein
MPPKKGENHKVILRPASRDLDINVKQKKLQKDILNLYCRKKTKFSIKKYEKYRVNT